MSQQQYTHTKKKILDATLEIIGREGFYNVTVRKVASLAGVNVAAINYHFGSKELLISQALHNITEQLKHSFDVLQQEDLPPQDRLHAFLSNYAMTITRYPDVIKNYIMQSICDYGFSGEYENFINDYGYKMIRNTIMEIRPEDSEIVIDIIIMQMMGGMAFPILVANRAIALKEFDYTHHEARKQFVDILLDSILPSPPIN